ncbi:hypothetical protein B0H19DRAFT_1070091 [Mycena capillaripes]|nr:hypothetical protein B0H19DRAFT_1070091 [Mycena capillaripes]
MQLKFVYLYLVLPFTPAVAGNGLIGSVPSLQQQILPEVFSIAVDPEKICYFWTRRSTSLMCQKIAEMKDAVSPFVRAATALQDELQASDALLEDLHHALGKMLEELQIIFPAPVGRLGREERWKVVLAALEKGGEAFIVVCVKHEKDEEKVRTLGDCATSDRDVALTALWMFYSTLIASHWLLLCPMGFWATGLGGSVNLWILIHPFAGTLASWAQRVVFGAVTQGS